jgi:hypothetical protein
MRRIIILKSHVRAYVDPHPPIIRKAFLQVTSEDNTTRYWRVQIAEETKQWANKYKK